MELDITNIEKLSTDQIEALINTLKARFEKHIHRHKTLEWETVQTRLESNPDKLISIYKMEQTGGEPDVVGYDERTDEYIICDCSPESPGGRRSLCYDQAALEARKENKPKGSAAGMALNIGIELLTEQQYYWLQSIEIFDQKTSSWVSTPDEIRKQKGALFCNFHYGRVFTSYNGADSYYAIRGFRGIIKI